MIGRLTQRQAGQPWPLFGYTLRLLEQPGALCRGHSYLRSSPSRFVRRELRLVGHLQPRKPAISVANRLGIRPANPTSIGASSNWLNNFAIAFFVPPMFEVRDCNASKIHEIELTHDFRRRGLGEHTSSSLYSWLVPSCGSISIFRRQRARRLKRWTACSTATLARGMQSFLERPSRKLVCLHNQGPRWYGWRRERRVMLSSSLSSLGGCNNTVWSRTQQSVEVHDVNDYLVTIEALRESLLRAFDQHRFHYSLC